ncbi:MAG TPA: arsenate reductase ArsC [Salinivirgaceae bacterium]|nr:arsenate reductase ArsC [Salinivirgaceae bacterium]HQA75850.1 arsenate reductase ArsC [Salinivirgaceae bacterium]
MSKRILLICDTNDCLSQIAEAYLKSFDNRLEVFSAGIEPAKQVNEFTIQVMNEVGIDISNNITKAANQFVTEPFDYIITLSNGANKNCPHFENSVKNRWHLAYEDPTIINDDKENLLMLFRQVRDDLHTGFLSFYRTQIEGHRECSCGNCNM